MPRTVAPTDPPCASAPRPLALVLLAAVLLASPAVSADWLQKAYDAGHSGDARQAGPEWGDVAYVREAPFFRNILAVVDGTLYFIASPSQEQADIRVVWRLDLATGEMAPFLDNPLPRTLGASDGSRLFLLGDARLDAYSLATGALEWGRDLTPNRSLTQAAREGDPANPCGFPAIANQTIFVVCATRPTAAAVITVQALDTVTGAFRWNWTADTDATALPGQVAGGLSLPASPGTIYPVGVSLAAGWVVAVTATEVAPSGASPVGGAYWDGWVLDPSDGSVPGEDEPSFAPFPGPSEPRFGRHPTMATFQNAPSPHQPWLVHGDDRILAFKNDPHEHPSSQASAGERLLTLYGSGLIRFGELRLANASEHRDDGMPLVVAGGSIYAASGSHLWKVDEALNIAWVQELAPGHYFPMSDPFVAQDRLYTMSADAADHGTLEVRDARDGHILWSHLFDSGGAALVMSDGLLAAVDYSTIFVFGRTALSLRPEATVTDAAPRAGARVGVDLSRTGPGANGTATGFRADWGDGSASDWGPEPRLSHVYASPGEVGARFFVRNDARQTASVPVVFRVGAAGPPASAGWLAAPFADPNLPLTLLLAGVLAVGSLGGAGFLLVRRRLAALGTRGPGVVAPGALVLGKYRVERELGAGSGGRVFLAQDVRMKRRVVLKTLASLDQATAFREARAGAAIDHPNVVRVYDVEDLGNQALLVMEHVDGGSLKERLAAGGALSEAAFARVAADLLAGLEAVHATGAVHRDLKPGNVLLTRDGHAKLSDFGIARLPGFEATLGSAASGSVQYMAPEQARGRRVTHLSDLYSAAATLFEARTGRALVQPREGENAIEMQMRIGEGPVFREALEPPALRAWFARALAKAPEDRFASAGEMRDALLAALGPQSDTPS